MNYFFAQLFELGGANLTEISDSLYDKNLYPTIGLVTLLLALTVFIVYYYVVNSPRYNKLKHWLVLMAGTSIVSAIFAFFYTYTKFEYLQLDYVAGDYIHFTITVLLFSMFFFFLFSIMGKYWSVNCSKTPF